MTPWNDRSGSQKKTTLTRFAALYGAITLIAVLFSWWMLAAIFGILAAGLAAFTLTIPGDAPGTTGDEPPREKPAWMEGIVLPSERPLDEPLPGPPPGTPGIDTPPAPPTPPDPSGGFRAD